MVAITLPSGLDWFYANWVYRQLASDVAIRYDDQEIRISLERAQWFGHLNLKDMKPEVSEKLIDALRTVALETVNGVIADWRHADPKRHKLYIGAVSELIKLIDQSRGASQTDH